MGGILANAVGVASKRDCRRGRGWDSREVKGVAGERIEYMWSRIDGANGPVCVCM